MNCEEDTGKLIIRIILELHVKLIKVIDCVFCYLSVLIESKVDNPQSAKRQKQSTLQSFRKKKFIYNYV